MRLTHCAVRERFGINLKRESASRSVSLLRELLHVVNSFFTRSLRLLSGIIRVRCLVLTSDPSCARVQDHVVSVNL